jgi:hypothetical protein
MSKSKDKPHIFRVHEKRIIHLRSLATEYEVEQAGDTKINIKISDQNHPLTSFYMTFAEDAKHQMEKTVPKNSLQSTA